MANKYRVVSLRDHILQHLEQDWPQTLWEWDKLERGIDGWLVSGQRMIAGAPAWTTAYPNPPRPSGWPKNVEFLVSCHLPSTISAVCIPTLSGAMIPWKTRLLTHTDSHAQQIGISLLRLITDTSSQLPGEVLRYQLEADPEIQTSA